METHPSPTPNPLNLPLKPSHGEATPLLIGVGWAALVVAGPLILLILKLFPAIDQPLLHNPRVHVIFSGGATFIGVLLALIVLQIARRVRDGRVFLVGMGFLSIASIFFIHSISTPNVLMSGRSAATSVSAILSLTLGGLFFALSGLDLSASLSRRLMDRSHIVLLLYGVFWLAYSVVFLVVAPTLEDGQYDAAAASAAVDHAAHLASSGVVAQTAALAPLGLARMAALAGGLGCYAFAVVRHRTLYRRAVSQTALAVICGIALFGEALLTQQMSQLYSLSFWLYHIEEFLGFGAISYAVISAYRHGQSGETILENLFLAGTRTRLQDEYAEAVDGLVATLSRGEQPTPGLMRALRGRFGLSESQVRVLEQAAMAVARERQQRQELEHLNAALRKLERDKDQLIQMVVHDLKNPLTALIGFLDILRMDSLNDMQRQLLENALRSSKNLSGLISDLLDVGRIEEGHLELSLVPFSLRDMFVDCAAEMSAWMVQDNKTLRIDAPGDLPVLHADARLMRRVLLNLLSNAIKHTPAGTQIILRAYVDPGHAEPTTDDDPGTFVIEVEDDGPGIPPEHLGLIFEKFGRVEGERVARQDSTGLGLTFCRLAIEAHGGLIGVTSVLDQGATFRITLPQPCRP